MFHLFLSCNFLLKRQDLVEGIRGSCRAQATSHHVRWQQSRWPVGANDGRSPVDSSINAERLLKMRDNWLLRNCRINMAGTILAAYAAAGDFFSL
jgi:hypothetical protein